MEKFKKYVLGLILFFICFNGFPQQNDKNPILYAEFYFGGALGYINGIILGGELNSQLNKTLFTLRYSGVVDVERQYFLGIPFLAETGSIDEFSLLLGQRYIQEGYSTSFSLGPSYNITEIYNAETGNMDRTDSFGLSLEANIKLFKNEKEKYRILYIIPVGEPTGFGRSIGLKLSGNISKTSYLGLSIISGLGWHKIY